MTAKQSRGPCTCPPPKPGYTGIYHLPDCPSLYSAQHEPDALTRLVRHVRQAHDISIVPQTATQVAEARERWTEQALSLISEVRAEMGGLRTRAEKAEHTERRVAQILEDAVRGNK